MQAEPDYAYVELSSSAVAVSPEGGVKTLFVGTSPDVAKSRLRVLQSGENTTNLSAEGTANCYVVKTNSSYFFDASVKGYGKAGLLFVAYNDIYYGIYPLLDPADAGSWYSYGARCAGASVRCVNEQK